MEYLVLGSLQKQRDEFGSDEYLNDKAEISSIVDRQVTTTTSSSRQCSPERRRAWTSKTTTGNMPDEDICDIQSSSVSDNQKSISPTTSKSLKVGARFAKDLYSCIQKKDIFGAVKILTGSLGKQKPGKKVEESEETVGVETVGASQTTAESIEPTVEETAIVPVTTITRGSYQTRLVPEQAEEMSRCWKDVGYESAPAHPSNEPSNDSGKEETSKEEPKPLETYIALFLTELEEFEGKVREPVNHCRTADGTLVNRRHNRLAKTLFDYAPIDLRHFTGVNLFGELSIEAKQRKVADTISLLKGHMIELMEELGKHSLNQPLDSLVSKSQRTSQSTIPPPPPPPPPSFHHPEHQHSRLNSDPQSNILVEMNSNPSLASSINAQLKRAATLRRTDLQRSPGGTPLRRKSPMRGAMERDLVESLRRRFKSMNNVLVEATALEE